MSTRVSDVEDALQARAAERVGLPPATWRREVLQAAALRALAPDRGDGDIVREAALERLLRLLG